MKSKTPNSSMDNDDLMSNQSVSQKSSLASSRTGTNRYDPCPKVYEEMIQGLEADIRKHIRIEHQLKLHIESLEDRIEELERDLDKLEANEVKMKEQLEKFKGTKDKQKTESALDELKKEVSKQKLDM